MIIDSRYKVIEDLGSGAFANVYKVSDIRTDKIYTLKLFHKIDAISLYKNLKAEEMHQITKLRHPNLLHIYNFGNMDKHIYYLAEYYPGISLKHFRFNLTTCHFLYDIIAQICYALDALHNQNITHKDIKPENILYQIINDQIEVKVLDYGFSKIDTERNQQKISGTLPYIAPETYMGKGHSPQSDFYSLGVTLYYIVTGTLPFSQDQIAEFIHGNQTNFFPKFPREYNPDIPIDLEKFILKLIQKKPEERFANCQAIIQYLNHMQDKKYPYSQKQSTINFFKFGYYLVRKEYALQLKDYLNNIVHSNGKIITLTGGQGLGKEDLLTLFRYHILTNEYYIFDYTCSLSNRDPFFALIKEFSSSALNNERKKFEFSRISDSFRRYLELSESSASQLNEDNENLEEDFKSSAEFIKTLSSEKPLIFIIRAGQYLTENTIKFLNYISETILQLPILIIISINDPSKIRSLKHYVQLMVKPLTIEESHTYLKEIFKTDLPQQFVESIWSRSHGNPKFIIEILIDLIQKKLLLHNENTNFDIDFKQYHLPENLIHSIYTRMSHLTAENYKYLQMLSCISMPLSKELIVYLLNITKKTLYALLTDALNNEILFKDKNTYSFAFHEAKYRFFIECSEKGKVDISRHLIEYYKDSENNDIQTVQGIIESCSLCKDYESLRHYKLELFNLYHHKHEQTKAYKEIYEIIKLDFSQDLKVPERDLRNDLLLFADKTDLTGFTKKSFDLLELYPNKPEIFEISYAYGMLYTRFEEFSKAEESYKKAYELAISGKQQARVLLDLIWIYCFKGDKATAFYYLNLLEAYQLTYDLEIAFYDRKGMFISKFENENEAILYLEKALTKIRQVNDASAILRLGSLYNNLGILYSNNKLYPEAKKYYDLTLNIWERHHHQRLLGTIYNNFGDFYLKQGVTIIALNFFKKAKAASELINNSRGMILALLNFGEAYIKLGDFVKAEEYLTEAKHFSEKVESHLFYKSIIYNLGTTKSKLYNFSNYLNFIHSEEVKTEFYDISSINPLIKSYFYYLCEIGQTEKINSLFLNNINFTKSHDEEFYYQIVGIVSLLKNDFNNAKNSFQKALVYATQIKSNYSISINYLRLAQCNIKLNNFKDAEENLKNAALLIEAHNFRYWGVVVQLFRVIIGLSKKEIPLRILLRNAFHILKITRENHYFILEIDCLAIISQIYESLSAHKCALQYFHDYQHKVRESIKDIPEEDQKTYSQIRKMYITQPKDFSLYPVANRNLKKNENCQNELFGLLRKDDVFEIYHALEKAIKDSFAPHRFAILYTKKVVSPESFLDPGNHTFYLSRKMNTEDFEPYKELMIASIKTKNVQTKTINDHHVMCAPLSLRSSNYGCLIIIDDGELEYMRHEINTMKSFSNQLSTLLIRIIEFESYQKKMQKMQEVLDISRKFIQVYDVKHLENDIINYAISLCNAQRGVLIKKDNAGNYLFNVAFDNEKNILSSFPNVSKTALIHVQNNKSPLYTVNIFEDNIFKHSPSIYQYQINSLFCAPIIIDGDVYGLLYLDNYEKIDEKMFIDEEVVNMFLVQISLAIKNALGYEALMKKNWELHTLDTMKSEFIAIVSHELNTPLITLQGYVSKLKRNSNPLDMETFDLLSKVDKSTNKLKQTIQDIITLNRYNAANDLILSEHNLFELLTTIVQEAELHGRTRKMKFKLEVEEHLPNINIEWKSFFLMIYNLILNAIRFTSDYGTIVIGARIATFQQEKVENQDSIVVYVQDNGIGIPEHEQENVFKSFYELGDMLAHRSGSIEYRSSGLGLGLSTSKRIAELHRGKIWLRSKEAEGTTIFVSIPMYQKENQDHLLTANIMNSKENI